MSHASQFLYKVSRFKHVQLSLSAFSTAELFMKSAHTCCYSLCLMSISYLFSKPGYGAFVPFHKLLMAWEWHKTCRSSPDLAHKLDSPHHNSPLPLNTCMTVFVSNHLLYKSIVQLKIVLFSDLDEELWVCSIMCCWTIQLTVSIPWSLTDKLHFCKVVFRLAQYRL